MKAEKFLKQLGLSVNIVIVILLLIIVYLLYCINDILSLERFSIGGTVPTGTRQPEEPTGTRQPGESTVSRQPIPTTRPPRPTR